MITSPESLTTRLASAGITKVAVIDDAFDDRKVITLAVGVDEFWTVIGDNEGWSEQLAANGVPFQDVDTFSTDGLIELWRKRAAFQGTLATAVTEMFSSAEEKLSYPTQVAENLKKLELAVECFDLPTAPSSEGPAEPRLEGVQLVFLDYDLEGEDNIDLVTSERRSHAIAKALARRRGDTPFLVLFSSLDGVQNEAENFREQAFYLRGSFLFLRKVDAANFDTLCQRLAPSCVWSRDIGHFQHFFVTLRERLREVADDVERSFLQLDVQDYAHFQHVALQEDGAPLGKYMLDLFGAVLSHEFRDGPQVQDARAALDRLDLTRQHLPFQTQPTAPLERIYRAVLTEPGISVGPAPPHPHTNGIPIEYRGNQRDMPPLLMLGDIFANGPEQPVYVVMNPACDLQYSMTGRKPKLDLSVFLLAGTLETLAVPASQPKLSERMRWLRYRDVDYRVLWESLRVETVPLIEFNRWQAEKGYERIARLSLPFSLALQQTWLAHLGHVGLPVSPPIHDAYDLALAIPDMANNSWSWVGGVLVQEAIVATHPADSSEPVRFCLTIAARDHLFDELTKAIVILQNPRKDAAQKAVTDPHLWWDLVTKYAVFEVVQGRGRWKFKPDGAGAPAVLCLWNAEPQQQDLDNLKSVAVVMVLRPH
jgi:hypothetical protein